MRFESTELVARAGCDEVHHKGWNGHESLTYT